MAQILDGKAHADRMLEVVRTSVEARITAGLRVPCLAVVLVGENPASQVYVKNKVAACTRTGIRSLEKFLPETTSSSTLMATILQLNEAPDVDGILVQLPLPKPLDAKAILQRINFNRAEYYRYTIIVVNSCINNN